MMAQHTNAFHDVVCPSSKYDNTYKIKRVSVTPYSYNYIMLNSQLIVMVHVHIVTIFCSPMKILFQICVCYLIYIVRT